MPITLVLSDPHPIVLFGLTCLLERESDIQVLAQSAHSDLAFEAVKIHLSNVYRKLGIDSRVDLTVLAREKGLV